MARGDENREGLKVFSIAYRDISIADLSDITSKYNEESPEFRDIIEKDLIYLCTFGFEDKIRDGVRNSISEIMTGKKAD
jgi:magnesium-transporting ATPase (P-type)